MGRFEIVDTADHPAAAASRATSLARDGVVQILMKGSRPRGLKGRATERTKGDNTYPRRIRFARGLP